jgi:S1-C subfamily serine protease
LVYVALALSLMVLVIFSMSRFSAPPDPSPPPAQTEAGPAPAGSAQPEPANPAPPVQEAAPPEKAVPGPARPDFDSQALVKRATVLVVTQSGFGSGFFIAPDLIMTNRHVVEKNAACLVANKALGQPMKAVVVAITTSRDMDFAVLRLQNKTDIQPLKFSLQARQSDQVATWGYPGLLLANWDQNNIPEVVYSSGEINVIDGSPPMIFHSAEISQGNSGGPLVNERGQVIGVNTFIVTDAPQRSNRQVGMALKAGDIIAFLRANRLPYTVAE